MADRSSIEWTDASWNPMRGCSRTIAAGAATSGCGDATGGGCYAERNGWRFAGPGMAYEGLVRLTARGPRWTGEVRLVDKHLLDPLRWSRPRKIFTTSVSDPFHDRFSNLDIAIVYGAMAATRRHTHQLLTKRVDRAAEWYAWLAAAAAAENGGRGMSPAAWCFCQLQRYVSDAARFTEADRRLLSRGAVVDEALAAPWPLPNLWLVASTEHQAAADDRIPQLLEIPAAVRGVSCEPLLGAIDLAPYIDPCAVPCGEDSEPMLDWVIVGAESGPGARAADTAWFESIVGQCTAHGVAVFVKQIVIDGELTTDIDKFPANLQRREFPR